MAKSTMDQTPIPERVLAVRLGDDLYALPIEAVQEVWPALPVESLPHCPAFIRGVVFVRGQSIPVLNGAERLGVKNHQRPLESHIVCLRIGERLIGIEVDEALDLWEFSPNDTLTSRDIGLETGAFLGVVEREGRIIRLLHPERLIQREESQALTRLSNTVESPRLGDGEAV